MNSTSLKTELSLFLRFMQRDAYLYRNRIMKYVTNYAIIYPVLYAFSFGYLQSQIYFQQSNALLGTILFTGNFLVVAIVLTYKLSIELLFDLEGERAIDYQITILRPQLVLLERIIFASLFAFVILLPYFPMAKFFLGSLLITTNVSWIKLATILYMACLLGASYNHLVACSLKNSHSLGFFWRRINMPLFITGGFWIPWYVMNNLSSLLGAITLCNPFLYITEGIRQSIISGNEFLPFYVCISALLGFSVLFTLLTFYMFKRRVDHI